MQATLPTMKDAHDAANHDERASAILFVGPLRRGLNHFGLFLAVPIPLDTLVTSLPIGIPARRKRRRYRHRCSLCAVVLVGRFYDAIRFGRYG